MRYFKNIVGLFCFNWPLPNTEVINVLGYIYRNKDWVNFDMSTTLLRENMLTFDDLTDEDKQRVLEKSLS